jgi:hypothetical protein
MVATFRAIVHDLPCYSAEKISYARLSLRTVFGYPAVLNSQPFLDLRSIVFLLSESGSGLDPDSATVWIQIRTRY